MSVRPRSRSRSRGGDDDERERTAVFPTIEVHSDDDARNLLVTFAYVARSILIPVALAVFLASDDSHGLTGRLISAPWDDWKTWGKKEIKKIMATDKFTLRRVQ